jgi:hypothetical protein
MKLAELQRAVRAADPAAVLVPQRILNRVVQEVARLPVLLWQVPHRQCFVVDRYVLFRHVEQDELDLEPEQHLPETVILVAQPTPEQLTNLRREDLLLEFWRRLFHAHVHAALEGEARAGRLSLAEVHERIEAVGHAEFEEVRRVLDQDGWLLPPVTDESSYVEFAAVFLELRYFAANLLPTYFPGIRDLARVEQLLRQGVDADALFARTRLPGAPEPVVRTDPRSDESNDYYWRLIRHADAANRSGNTVRAAVVRTRAARVAPASLTASTRRAAEADLGRLTTRLQAALSLSDAEVAEWLKVLPALLEKADQGSHPVEAALLYDLQKACVDHERTIYALDLVEWAVSGGKRPVMRPLPSQRLVRIIKHLRSAAQRLTLARLTDADREHLAGLLQVAQARSEERLRERLRPVLTEALTDVRLQPANPPERVAFLKVVEELLDRVIDYGFLTFGDLRDTLSRNQLKLPDPADAQEFIVGDPLLRLDRRLATLLDGVYRPSEFYLRWLERFTALNFGTHAGRIVTRYVAAPFGGAALVVYGLNEVWEDFQRKSLLKSPNASTAATAEAAAAVPANANRDAPVHGLSLLGQLLVILALGLAAAALINSRSLRRRARRVLVTAGRAGRTVLVDWPRRLARVEALRALVESWPFQLFYGYLLKPLVATAVVAWWVEDLRTWLGAAIVFLVTNFVLNSRLGRAATEVVSQFVVRFVDLLRQGLVQGVFRFVLALFKRIVDAVQYVLFTVDEWLRYRAGDSRFTMALQTVLGVVWYPVSYLTRFYTVVLIEPWLNPVKAPVSILAAKIVLPATYWMVGPVVARLEPVVGSFAAYPIVWLTWWLLPDAVTFLLWEMKENWRLYRANRQPELRPVAVGPQGETVRHLLHPGVHSGTIPRLYARLRKAERDAGVTGNWRAARVCRRALLDVEKSLQRLVARELVPLLEPYLGGPDPRWGVGRVEMASNRVRLELAHADRPGRAAWLEWQDQEGWLTARLADAGWLADLPPAPRQAVATALAGLYKLAGIDVIHEQVLANLPAPVARFDLAPRDLVLWLDRRYGKAVWYDLEDLNGRLRPRSPGGGPAPDWPVLDAVRILYARQPITWKQWVESWQDRQAGPLLLALARAGVEVLPAGGAAAESPPTSGAPGPGHAVAVHPGSVAGANGADERTDVPIPTGSPARGAP